ncbi:hypothetical protein ACFLY6_03500, partial [Candidatus Dependentiae bacterium]
YEKSSDDLKENLDSNLIKRILYIIRHDTFLESPDGFLDCEKPLAKKHWRVFLWPNSEVGFQFNLGGGPKLLIIDPDRPGRCLKILSAVMAFYLKKAREVMASTLLFNKGDWKYGVIKLFNDVGLMMSYGDCKLFLDGLLVYRDYPFYLNIKWGAQRLVLEIDKVSGEMFVRIPSIGIFRKSYSKERGRRKLLEECCDEFGGGMQNLSSMIMGYHFGQEIEEYEKLLGIVKSLDFHTLRKKALFQKKENIMFKR